jgi:hypothetical protein
MDPQTEQIISDSLHVAEKSGESDWILHHSLDSNVLDFEPFISIPLPHINNQAPGLYVVCRYSTFCFVVECCKAI